MVTDGWFQKNNVGNSSTIMVTDAWMNTKNASCVPADFDQSRAQTNEISRRLMNGSGNHGMCYCMSRFETGHSQVDGRAVNDILFVRIWQTGAVASAKVNLQP
eukprot:scaffold5772_cov188-Amphora_coffeaeformis.AAC.10